MVINVLKLIDLRTVAKWEKNLLKQPKSLQSNHRKLTELDNIRQQRR